MLENTGSNSSINFSSEVLLKFSRDTVKKNRRKCVLKSWLVSMWCVICGRASLLDLITYNFLK